MASADEALCRREILDERAMRIIALALLLITLLVAGHQMWGSDQPSQIGGEILQERSVAFRFEPERGTEIIGTNGNVIASFGSGDGGILEMLAVVIDRNRLRFSPATSDQIIVRLRNGGRVSIFDPATGQEINMASYGEDNIAFLRGVVFPEF